MHSYRLAAVALLTMMSDVINGNDVMICKSVSDADFGSGMSTNQATRDRIHALEEQVRQLQTLVGGGLESLNHTTVPGIPRGESWLYSVYNYVDSIKLKFKS